MGKLDFLKKKTKSYVLSWDGITEGKEKVTELDDGSTSNVSDMYLISEEEYEFDMSQESNWTAPLPGDIKPCKNFGQYSNLCSIIKDNGMLISMTPNDDNINGGTLVYAAIPGALLGNGTLNPNHDMVFPKKGWWYCPSARGDATIAEDLVIVERPINNKASYTTSKSDKVGGAAPYKIMPYRSMVPGEYMVLYARNVLASSYEFDKAIENGCESFSYLYYPDEILEIVDAEAENVIAEPSNLAHVTYEDILKIALYCEAEERQRCTALVTDIAVTDYGMSMNSGSDGIIGTGDDVSYDLYTNSTDVFATLSTSTGMIAGARIDDALIIDVGEVSGSFDSSGHTTFRGIHEICVSEDMFSKLCTSYETAYTDYIHHKGIAERGYYVDRGVKIKYCSLKRPMINYPDVGYIIPSEGVAFIVGSRTFASDVGLYGTAASLAVHASDVGLYGTAASLAVHTKRHPKKTYDLIWDGVTEGRTIGGSTVVKYYYISDKEYNVVVPSNIKENPSSTTDAYFYNISFHQTTALANVRSRDLLLKDGNNVSGPVTGYLSATKIGYILYAPMDNVSCDGGFFGNAQGTFPKRGWYFYPKSLSVDEPITIATVEAPN